jgi:hypothetical protein
VAESLFSIIYRKRKDTNKQTKTHTHTHTHTFSSVFVKELNLGRKTRDKIKLCSICNCHFGEIPSFTLSSLR